MFNVLGKVKKNLPALEDKKISLSFNICSEEINKFCKMLSNQPLEF